MNKKQVLFTLLCLLLGFGPFFAALLGPMMGYGQGVGIIAVATVYTLLFFAIIASIGTLLLENETSPKLFDPFGAMFSSEVVIGRKHSKERMSLGLMLGIISLVVPVFAVFFVPFGIVLVIAGLCQFVFPELTGKKIGLLLFLLILSIVILLIRGGGRRY